MGLFDSIKNFLWKEGGKMGIGKSLVNITDDERINIDPSEYERINKDLVYYSGLPSDVKYHTSDGQETIRKQIGVNMTEKVARRLASIVFNEKCEISFENTALSDFINEVLESNNFKNEFEMRLEQAIVCGGIAVRPYVDGNQIKLAWVRADQFYPLQSNTNNISEAALASITTQIENDTVMYYTMLEFHQWKDGQYTITNELYRSDAKDSVGTSVPLDSIDKYKGIEPEVTLDGDQMINPLFCYMRMPGANNVSLESPLGLGIVDNNKHTLDNINNTNDAFMWEIKVGKRRIVVPASMLKTDKAHKPMFDTSDGVYEGLNTENGDVIQDLTKDIRTQEYIDAMNFWLKQLESGVGLADGTFSFDPKTGIQTATAVVSENSMTYQTRSSILTNVSAFINDLCTAILELAQSSQLFDGQQALFSLPDGVDMHNLKMNVHYDDGVFVDKDAQAKQDMLAVSSGIMPKVQFLMRNYGLSQNDAQDWVDQVQAETPEPAPSAETGMFGGD